MRAVAEQNDRGGALAAGGKERAKVGVGGNQHTLLLLRPSENLLVGGRLHVVIADMRRIVPSVFQSLGKHRRERVVDQKLHPEAASGNSRSRTASAA